MINSININLTGLCDKLQLFFFLYIKQLHAKTYGETCITRGINLRSFTDKVKSSPELNAEKLQPIDPMSSLSGTMPCL